MEDPLVRQPSSGTIISHNAHLLLDPPENSENNGSFNSDDNGHDRPASDSSQLSREMDASPIDDEERNSEESLDEEARYQKELKDRVRRSYADLGMEPEGILLKQEEEATPQDSIDINENLDYGKIKTTKRGDISNELIEEEQTDDQPLISSQEDGRQDDDVSPPGEYSKESVAVNEPFVKDVTDHQVQNNGINNVSDEYASADEVRNVNSAAGERRGEELSNNYKSDVPEYQSERVTSPDAARSRLSRQSKIQDQEESEGNNISDGKNVLGLEDRVRDDLETSGQTYANVVQDQGLVNDNSEQGHEYANDNLEDRRAADVYGDGYANEVPEDTANQGEPHPGEEEYLRDSLEEDVPRDLEMGREQELRKGRRVDEEDAFRDSLEDQTQQVIPSRLENGIHGNVNNNAQPGGSPPVRSKSDRTHANVGKDQGLVNDSSEQDDEYANDYWEDRRVEGVYGDEYANNAPELLPEDTANQGQSHHFHPNRREPQRSQENNAAHDDVRAPPVPPPMPPEPPPPIPRGKTPPGGVSSRPATNPFRIDSQQGGHQSLEYLPTHQQNQDARRENDQFQSKAAPAVEEHERPSAQGSQGKIVNLRNNPYHAEFLNHAAKEQPLSTHDLPQPVPPPPATNRRVHPPPPQSQTFQDQNFIPEADQDYPPARQPIQSAEKLLNQPLSSGPSSRQLNPSQIPENPRQELQLSKSPLRVRESPRQGISPSRTPLHLRQQEKSYLDQFRDKQRSSDGNRQGDPSDPGRISQHSNRNVQERQEGYPNQASDRDLPVRTLESQKGFQGYGRNSRGSGAANEGNASSQGQPQRNPKEANGSLASLESLRFQGLPRQDSHTKANNKEEEKMIKTLPSGEMLHVAYISDDSDDEDMHFVDEMGNPVDTHGNLLTKSPSLKEDQPPKLEYRIKPTPPKQKSSSGVRSPSGVKQASSGGRTVGSGRALVNQTAQIPSAVSIRRQTTIDKAVGESKAPSPDVPAAEEFITKTTAQMEGEMSGTLPDPSATSKRPPSSGRRWTSENAQPFGNVTVASLQGQPQYGYPPNMNPGMHMAYQMPHQFVASQVPGQMVLANQPAIISPNASYSFAPQMYAQIQPTVAMSPVQTILQPVMQHPQVYMGGPSQFQPQFMPAQVQAGPNVYGVLQGEVGVSERSGPSQESQVTDKNLDEDEEEEESPQEEEDVPPASEQRRGKHPKGVRGLLADRNKEKRPKKTIPKAGKNFIDANKNNVKNLPREKKYKDLYGNVKTKKQPLNRKEPLPNISQDEEDSGEERWAYREDANAYREDEEWARQLVEEQRLMAALKRNQSDSNILDRHTVRRQGYDDPRGYGGGTYPPGENWKNADGQPYSYSADRAVTYARMQGPGNKGYKQNVSFKDVSMVPQDGGRSGPRERFAYTHPMPTSRYSPYDILPDISAEENEQLRVSDPNGYLMKLHKQREPPNYKEYTVKDYRALKRDIRLGGLGPDPELVHERQEKAQRQREYAKVIMQQNKKSMKRPEKPWTPPNEKPQGQENSRRGAALRYAKNISRPPLRTPQEELHARIYGTNSRLKDDFQVRDGAKTYMVDEIAKLEELAERHRQEKEEINKLRSGQAP